MIYIICLILILLIVLLVVGWRFHITRKNKEIKKLHIENNALNLNKEIKKDVASMSKKQQLEELMNRGNYD